MLIVNADDWGRCSVDTDSALACYRARRITSVSAMVFMADSERAAGIALEHNIHPGLHINLSESFSAKCDSVIRQQHSRIVAFLTRSKYAQLLFNPLLLKSFDFVFQAQLTEYVRLYGRLPSHFDGHQHMHLCTNMLVACPIPNGQRVRRSFSFRKGQKGVFNRAYRAWVDGKIRARYRVADLFVALSQHLPVNRLTGIMESARQLNVELMTHPAVKGEFDALMSSDYENLCKGVPMGTYLDL